MNKKLKIYLPVLFSIMIIIGMFLGAKLGPVNRTFNGIFSADVKNYNKINDIMYLIQREYVDSISNNDLADYAIKGMLKELDPHSYYLSTEELSRANEMLNGNFEGIGVQFRIYRDTIYVIKAIENGPSEKAGILAGDRIVFVDDEDITQINISDEDVIKRLKGPKGSDVKLKVFRKGEKELLDITVTRGVIPTQSVDIAYMINDKTAYLKINTFASTTYYEFMEQMEALEEKGMKDLILDLRGNSGGLLDQAAKIADELLKSKKPIVYTEGRMYEKDGIYSTSNDAFVDGQLVVLIDDLSASASEIIAGAIQDNDRGIIIGRRSYGKGLVQRQIDLSDGSALRITTARYYTPSGRCIQKSYAEGREEYESDLMDRYIHGEMENADSIKFIDSLKYKTLEKGRTVYGGGGIMPDIFVPINSKEHSFWFNQVANNGLIYQLAFEYTDKYREKLGKYKDYKQFMNSFKMSKAEYDKLIVLSKQRGIKFNKDDFKKSKQLIENRFKAFIARNMFDDEGFYPILHQKDHTLLKAITVVKKGEARL